MINNKSDLIEYLNEDKRIMNPDRKNRIYIRCAGNI